MHNLNTGITVIIPTYNSEKFIKRTLKSLEDQKELPDEIIFSDDGSTDETVQTIESWARDKKGINYKILKNYHKGPGSTRNKGILCAQNKWIAFLDSDDTWHENKIFEIKKTILLNKNVNFIVHYELHEDQKGIVKEISKKLKAFENSNQNLKKYLYQSNIFSTSAVVCSKSLLEEKGLFDVNLSNGQDYELWLRLSPKINLHIINKNLGTYYDSLNNITSRYYLKRIRAELIICFRYKSYVKTSIFILKFLKIFITKNWIKF